MALPPLIGALLDPARYPHPAAPLAVAETHASWVLLAGDYAYKIKKPVNCARPSTAPNRAYISSSR